MDWEQKETPHQWGNLLVFRLLLLLPMCVCMCSVGRKERPLQKRPNEATQLVVLVTSLASSRALQRLGDETNDAFLGLIVNPFFAQLWPGLALKKKGNEASLSYLSSSGIFASNNNNVCHANNANCKLSSDDGGRFFAPRRLLLLPTCPL